MSVSWIHPPSDRATEREIERTVFVFGLSGQTNQSHLRLLHTLSSPLLPSLRPPTHIVFLRSSPAPEVFDQTSRSASSPPPRTRLPATPEQATKIAARTACHSSSARHCPLSVPLDRRRDYTAFASPALCRPEPEHTHCDGPVRGHEVNGRGHFLYFSDGGKRDQSNPIIRTAAGPCPSAPLTPPPFRFGCWTETPTCFVRGELFCQLNQCASVLRFD